MQAPSHLLTDVTEAGGWRAGGDMEGGEGRDLHTTENILQGVHPSMNSLGGEDIFKNSHKEARINNHKCLFPQDQYPQEGKGKRDGGGGKLFTERH